MLAHYKTLSNLTNEAKANLGRFLSDDIDAKTFSRKMESVLARYRSTNTRFGKFYAICFAAMSRLACPAFKERLR